MEVIEIYCMNNNSRNYWFRYICNWFHKNNIMIKCYKHWNQIAVNEKLIMFNAPNDNEKRMVGYHNIKYSSTDALLDKDFKKEMKNILEIIYG